LSFNPDHAESHIALAEAALIAELWGEARNHLHKAAGGDPPARVCRMMADLEGRSGEDPGAMQTWLLRASTAPPDPAWICGKCGAAWESWKPVCGDCNTLSTLKWQPRARGLGLRLGDGETLLLDDEIKDDAPGGTADRWADAYPQAGNIDAVAGDDAPKPP